MNHDPLCPLPYCDYGLPKGECMGYEDCWHHCACHIISAARAEEREKAAKRIWTLKPDRVYTSGGIAYTDALKDAIEAVYGRADIVRGES